MTKTLREALRQLHAAGSTWTITMVDTYYRQARKLEEQGFVEFRPLYVQRGKFRGQPKGSAVVVTAAGRALLRGLS